MIKFTSDNTLTTRAFNVDQQDDDVSVVKDLALAVPRGIEGAVQGVYGLADFVTFDALPDYDERLLGRSETMAGGFVEGATNFMTGFVPIAGQLGKVGQAGRLAKAVKAAKGTRKAKDLKKAYRRSRALTNIGAGAITDFTVFDAHEQRLSDFIQDTALANPVSEFLASDPNDNEIIGRLKNTIEGLFIEAGVAPVGKAFTATLDRLKAGKELRDGQKPEEEMLRAFRSLFVSEGDTVDGLRELSSDVNFASFLEKNYDPKAEFTSVYDIAESWLKTEDAKGDTFAPMLQNLLKTSEKTLKDAKFGTMSERLKKIEKAKGVFYPDDNSIKMATDENSPRATFLHEIIHAVTVNNLDSKLGAFSSGLFKETSSTVPAKGRFLDYLKELETKRAGLDREDPAARLIDAYLDTVTEGIGVGAFKNVEDVEKLIQRRNLDGQQTYGFANVYEFASEFISNRSFANQVGLSKQGRSQKLHVRIMEAIRDLLGIPTQYRGAFNDALSGIQGLARETEMDFTPTDRSFKNRSLEPLANRLDDSEAGNMGMNKTIKTPEDAQRAIDSIIAKSMTGGEELAPLHGMLIEYKSSKGYDVKEIYEEADNQGFSKFEVDQMLKSDDPTDLMESLQMAREKADAGDGLVLQFFNSLDEFSQNRLISLLMDGPYDFIAKGLAKKQGEGKRLSSKSFEDDLFNNKEMLDGLDEEDLARLDMLELERSMTDLEKTKSEFADDSVAYQSKQLNEGEGDGGDLSEEAIFSQRNADGSDTSIDAGAEALDQSVMSQILEDPETGKFLDQFPPEKRAEALKGLMRERVADKTGVRDINEESIRLDEPTEIEFRRQLAEAVEAIPEEKLAKMRETVAGFERELPKEARNKTTAKEIGETVVDREAFVQKTIERTRQTEANVYESFFTDMRREMESLFGGKENIPKVYDYILNAKLQKDGKPASNRLKRHHLRVQLLKDLNIKIDENGKLTKEARLRLYDSQIFRDFRFKINAKGGLDITARNKKILTEYINSGVVDLKLDKKGELTKESQQRLLNVSKNKLGGLLSKVIGLDERLLEQQDMRLNATWRAYWVEGQSAKPTSTAAISERSRAAAKGDLLRKMEADKVARIMGNVDKIDPDTIRRGLEANIARIEANIKFYGDLNQKVRVKRLQQDLDLVREEAEFFEANGYNIARTGIKPRRTTKVFSGEEDELFKNPDPKPREPLILVEGERIMGSDALDNALDSIGSSMGLSVLLRNVVDDLKKALPQVGDNFDDLRQTTDSLTASLGGDNDTFTDVYETMLKRGESLNQVRLEQAAVFRVMSSLDDKIRSKAKALKESGSDNITTAQKAEFLEATDRLYELGRIWNLYGNQLGRSLVQRKALMQGKTSAMTDGILPSVESILNKSPMNNKEIGVQGPRDARGTGSYVNQKGLESDQAFEERVEDFARATSTEEVVKIAKGMHGSKLMDIVLEYWTNSLLSGPTTQVVNIVGNGALFALRMLETTAGAALTLNPKLLQASLGAAFSFDGFYESMKIAWKAGVTGENTLTQGSKAFDDGYISQPKITAKNLGEQFGKMTGRSEPVAVESLGAWGAAVNFLGKGIRIPSSMLAGGDEFFKQINYRYMAKTMLSYDAIANKGLKGSGLKKYLKESYGKILQQGRAYNQENLDLNWYNANIRPKLESGAMKPEEAKKMDSEYRAGKLKDKEGNLVDRQVVEEGLNAHANVALKFARENTFTEDLDPDTMLGAMGNSINALKRNDATKFLSFVIPFVRTPTNILKTAIDRTPAGVEYRRLAGDTGRIFLSKLTGKQAQLKSALLSKDPTARAQAVGQIASGTMFASTALYFAMNSSEQGVITGGGPADADRRRALQMSGWQPYSIKIGDNYFSYNKLDPISSVVGIYVDMVEAFRYQEVDGDILENAFSVLAMSTVNNIANKSFLQGMSNVLDVLKDPLGATERAVGDVFAGFVPTAFQQVMNFEQVRELKEARGFVDRIIKRTPFSGSLMPKRNALGEKIMIENTPAGPLFPSYIRSISDDPVDQEIARLNKGFSIPKPKIMNSFDMRKFENEDGQTAYDNFQQQAGNTKINGLTLREALNRFIKSPSYKRLDSGTDAELQLGMQPPRVKALQKIINRYRSVGKRKMFQEFPELQGEIDNLLKKRSNIRNGI